MKSISANSNFRDDGAASKNRKSNSPWATRCEIWRGCAEKASARSTKRATPSPALIMAGHGVSMRIQGDALAIKNGLTHFPQKQEEYLFFRGDPNLPDEARVGQKNKITRRWAKRGTRPSAPRDQRTSSAYIFGAICPAEGKGAGLSSCRPATARPWPCISRRSQLLWRLERTPSSSSTRGGMACLEEAAGARQHHAPASALEIPRVEPSREHLAVHARQLAFEPRLQILRRHPRPLLLRMEQAHRYALENHVHRNKRMGISVLITETWYKASGPPV